jgi:hypothetical protein
VGLQGSTSSNMLWAQAYELLSGTVWRHQQLHSQHSAHLQVPTQLQAYMQRGRGCKAWAQACQLVRRAVWGHEQLHDLRMAHLQMPTRPQGDAPQAYNRLRSSIQELESTTGGRTELGLYGVLNSLAACI